MPFNLIRDKGREGRRGYTLPKPDVEMKELETILPGSVLRKQKPRLAEVDEPTVIRHYTNLARENEGIDTTFYPLGSCTMKHNPRANEAAAVVPGFSGLHPLQPEAQGALRIMHELQGFLAEVSGLPYVSLQPLAGAQGELTSILMVKKFFEDAGDDGRTTVLVPSTAHGTNPATASMAGFGAKEVGLDEHGCVDVDELREMVDESTAALMITNPNTCGVYERNIKEIAEVLREAGAFLYMDGANMNANMGRMRPAEADVDIMHFNLHKTFSTPHGGGGPGCGAIACSEDLAPFLPDPTVEKEGDAYRFVHPEKSIGRVAGFHGNFGQMLRAWNYIRMHGPELRDVTDMAVLNANYVRAQLRGSYRIPYDELCKHEVVVQPPQGKRALDIAKGLIDYGYHPPTIYFPLVVKEAMLIEPTETESKETLDDFIGTMLELAETSHEDLGARLVDFAGYEMPVQYSGIQAEHNAVRNHAGLFDVSHMGEAVFRGPDAESAVQRLVTRDVARLDVGQAGYSAVCYEDGGTVDDVIVYRREDDFLVVINASNRDKDLEHFRKNTEDLDVEVADESDDWALLALQGPEAADLHQDLTETDLSGLKPFRFAWGEVDGARSIISRTGYTGEDGFEIYLSPDDAPRVWRRLLEAGATPAGLGARDTLRLEAGMCLYGNELDAETTPLEAGISFAVHLDKEERFIGQRALLLEDTEGLRKKLVGFEMEGRGIARHGHHVTSGAEIVGEVTSGTKSPTLDRAIGLALVDPDVDDWFEIVIRENPVPARAVPIPFYKRDRG